MSPDSGRALLCVVAAVLAPSVGTYAAQSQVPAISPHHLATLVDLDGVSVSPDGQWAVFLTRAPDPEANAYAQTWRVVPLAGGPSRTVSDGGEPIQLVDMGRVHGALVNSPPVWSPDSQWIAFLRRDGGRTQAWRAHVPGGRVQQLTQGPGDTRELHFSAQGDRLLYESEPSQLQIAAALAAEGRQGFRYDNRFFPSHSTIPTMPADASFQGKRELTTDAQQAGRAIRVVDLTDLRDRVANPAEMEEFAASSGARGVEIATIRSTAVMSRAGGRLWAEAGDPKRQGAMPPRTVVVQRPADPKPIVCRLPACTSQDLRGLWWRNEHEVLFARRESPASPDTSLYAWRIGEAAARLVLRTANEFVSNELITFSEWRCAMGQDRLVCFYAEPTRPRRLVAIDPDTGDVQTLYDPNPNFVRLDSGPPAQRIDIRTADGVETYGYLLLPRGRREGVRLSLVIVTYRCGGFLRGGTGDEYPMLPLVAAGHAVFCFSVPDLDYARLETMDWDAYLQWSRGEGDPEKRRVQTALETLIADLDRAGVIDPGRVGLTGLSFGAETTFYALWNWPRLAAAITSGSGFEPADAFLHGPAASALMSAWGMGDETSDRWNTRALSRNTSRVRAPLLLNVADHEMRSALQPVTALARADRAVEMFVYPDEYHFKWQPAHRLAIYHRNIDWMNFWLRGVEDPAPAKAEQYVRWRAMRVKQCELFKGEGAPWYCRADQSAGH